MRFLILLPLLAGCFEADTDAPYDHDRERDVLGGKADGQPAPTKAWTLLHYGAGDNNLADAIFADVNEMEQVGSSSEVNVVAFLDHAELGASRIYVERDDDPYQIGSAQLQLGAVDSGTPETFTQFAAWAIDSFPAAHYAVVIGGHGGGTPRVIAPDDATGNSMSLPELWQAVAFVHQRTGNRIAVFGGDACLMQTVETAAELAGDVDFLVASELTEPGPGWNYQAILADLTAHPDRLPIDLAGAMVESYRTGYPDDEVTLTAVDTGRVPDLAESLSRLSTAVRNDPAGDAAMADVAAGGYRPHPGDLYVDVRGMAELLLARADLGGAARTAADDIAYDVEGTVVARVVSDTALGGAHGVSVLWPERGELTAEQLAYYRQGKLATGAWDELVAWFQGL